MSLLQLHHDDLRGLKGMLARAFARLAAVCRLMHRAIVDAKLRRLENEPTFDFGYADDLPEEPFVDATGAKYPQRPLVLGDKWDF